MKLWLCNQKEWSLAYHLRYPSNWAERSFVNLVLIWYFGQKWMLSCFHILQQPDSDRLQLWQANHGETTFWRWNEQHWDASRMIWWTLMNTFYWICEYMGSRLMKVNPRSKFKANIMLFRAADLKNWIQWVQWIQIGKGLIIPIWSYVRLEQMPSARPDWTTSCSTSSVETWWWYPQARAFIHKLPSVFFQRVENLRTEVEISFCFSVKLFFWMIGGKRLPKWKSAWNFEMPMRRWKRLKKFQKGWPGVAGLRAMSLPVFKTSQISVCVSTFCNVLLVLVVLSLWKSYVASCIECRAQVNRIEEFIQQGFCYHKWICRGALHLVNWHMIDSKDETLAARSTKGTQTATKPLGVDLELQLTYRHSASWEWARWSLGCVWETTKISKSTWCCDILSIDQSFY